MRRLGDFAMQFSEASKRGGEHHLRLDSERSRCGLHDELREIRFERLKTYDQVRAGERRAEEGQWVQPARVNMGG